MSTEQPPPPQQEDTEMPPPPPLQSQSQPSPAPQPQQPPSSDDPAQTSDPIPSDTAPPNDQQDLTPGPRAQRLRALFQQTTAHTLDKLSPANFRECFPTISQKAPGTLDNVHRQMMERLNTLWNREFERILETRSVIQKLNELETLIQEAQQKRKGAGRGQGQGRGAGVNGTGDGWGHNGNGVPIPPHTLDADVVLQAHLRGYLKEQEGVLEGKLGEVRGDNKKLFEEVLAQRREMEGLIKGVEGVMGDVKGAGEVLGSVTGELEHETREVDRELGRVRGEV